MPPISKSTFLQFQMCPKDTWLKLHKPELAVEFAPTEFELHLMEQGNEVEAVARKLWPDAVLVTASGEEAIRETARLMAAGATIFQATFVAEGFLAKCDVLSPAAGGAWDLYEIKGTNSKKEGNEDRDHISDLAFQTLVLTRAGVRVGRSFIVHLNKEYVRQGALDIGSLFIVDDSTDQVADAGADIGRGMEAAKEYLNREEEPGIGCDCHLKGRSRHCRTFAYSHPEIPEYSVHDIVRIGQSKKKLAELMERRIFALDDIPDDFALGDAQRNQVTAHRDRAPIVNIEAIREALQSYAYPLYFFDYETFAPAVPAFDSFSPYRRIPFQFSLHVLRAPDAELAHEEFLHEGLSDPTVSVAEFLAARIDPGGSVIVWYAPFERGVNEEIAKRSPAHAEALRRINGQLRDLRDVFAAQHYVHPDFRGSTSIKAVLPVLVPELSYTDLVIQEGGTASEEWWKMVASGATDEERRAIAEALRAYCKRDTYAMYAIWKKLWDEVRRPVLA